MKRCNIKQKRGKGPGEIADSRKSALLCWLLVFTRQAPTPTSARQKEERASRSRAPRGRGGHRHYPEELRANGGPACSPSRCDLLIRLLAIISSIFELEDVDWPPVLIIFTAFFTLSFFASCASTRRWASADSIDWRGQQTSNTTSSGKKLPRRQRRLRHWHRHLSEKSSYIVDSSRNSAKSLIWVHHREHDRPCTRARLLNTTTKEKHGLPRKSPCLAFPLSIALGFDLFLL